MARDFWKLGAERKLKLLHSSCQENSPELFLFVLGNMVGRVGIVRIMEKCVYYMKFFFIVFSNWIF